MPGAPASFSFFPNLLPTTSHCLLIFLLANHPLFYPQMADHLESAHFQALFESALQSYVKETGITLVEHPFAVQLQSCNSVESIDNLVQDQTQAFSNFLESDRITKSIKAVVSKSNTLSATAFLGDAVGLVRQNLLVGLPHSNRLLLPGNLSCGCITCCACYPP